MMKRNVNAILRLVASLCLVAGVSAITAGCGDDDACEEGELDVEEHGCVASCDNDDDCAGDESCTALDGVDEDACIPDEDDSNDSNNNGPECESDGDCEDGVCDDNEECVECVDAEDCETEGALCVENTCEAPGDASCGEVIACVMACSADSETCQQDCILEGTSEAQQQFDTLNTCASENCSNSQDPDCIENNCSSEIRTCGDCTDEDVIVGFQCYPDCQEDADCGENEECAQPYFGRADEQVCTYTPDNLSGECSGNSECGGPDESVVGEGAQIGGLCNVPEGESEGMCLALGCNPGGQQNAYGQATGCGFQGICFAIPDDQGNPTEDGYCQKLCRENSDCVGGDTGDSACRIVQDTEEEGILGICNSACSGDEDCEFEGDGETTQGRCNSQSYCDLPCEGDGSDCEEIGGTCDEDDFCVFDTGT